MTDEQNKGNSNQRPEELIKTALLEQGIAHLEARVAKMETSLNKLFWVVISSVVVAGINIIKSGSVAGIV